MKMKIKQTLRSMWALILAVLMLLSTFSAVAVTLNTEGTGTDYGSSSVTFKTGEKIYYDLTGYGKGANIYNANGDALGAWQNDVSSIVVVTLTKDLTITTSSNLFKTEASSWNGVTCSTLPTNGQNMIVSTDGKTASWSTYSESGSSGGSSDQYTIYFKNTLGWSSVYAHFYNNSYNPSDTNGCSGKDAKQHVNLTKIGDTNIYSATFSSSTAYTKVCFTEYLQDNYGNFHHNKAAYRTDLNFASGKTMYVPETTSSSTLNGGTVPYYNKGTWETYGSTSTTTTKATTTTTSPATSSYTLYGKTTGNDESLGSFITAGSNTYTLTKTLSANTTYNLFIKDNYNTYYRNGSGTISSDGGSVKLYKYGSNIDTHYIQLQTTSAGEYTFTWTYTSGANDGTLTVTYPQTATTYDVTLTQATGGTISGSPLTNLEGTKTITLKATPVPGYEFTGWSASTNPGNVTFTSTSNAETTATVTGACTITAEFTQLSAATSLEVTATPSSCKVGDTITLGYTGTVVDGATVTYKYSTDDGSSWSDATQSFVPSSDGTYKFRVTASKTGYQTVTSTNDPSVTVNNNPDVAQSVTLSADPTSVEVGDAITLTASLTDKNEGATSVKYSYVQTSNLAGSFTETVTNTDSTTATFTPSAAGTYKFKVTASCDGYNPVQSSEVTVTVTAPVDVKGDAFTSGMWIDAQPDENTADAMVKPYFGTSGKVKFYLPGSVDLENVHFYHKYNSLTIEGVKDPIISGKIYNISSWNGKQISYGGEKRTLQIFKSTAKSFFTTTYTKAEDGTKTPQDMPTSKKPDNISVSDFKKQCNFSGTYVALTTDGKTINSDKKLKSIKGRGNSSWEASCTQFGKYAYNISLGAKADLAPGGTPSKKWSMLANNADEAMMRNILVYNLADAIGLPDSPMSDVYDVYNNGTYLGSYQMAEKVEVGKSGALVPGTNVDKLNKELLANSTYDFDKPKRNSSNGANDLNNTSTPGYYKYCENFVTPPEYKTGNYLLEFELNERFDDEISGFISNKGQQVVLKSPEIASKDEVLYAMDRFNFAEAVIYYLASGSTVTSVTLPAGTLTINGDSYSYKGKDSGNTYSTTNLDLGELINVENFAKAYLIQEFTENLDGVATSFYVDITGEKDALVSKPVWDFDWTMGQYSKPKAIGGNQADRDPSITNQWFIKDKYIYSKNNSNGTNKNIMATLCSIESFWAKVKDVWNGTSSTSLLSTGSSNLFPVSALMGKKASLNPVGAATGNSVYTEIQSLYGASGKIQTTYKTALESSVAMNEDRYGFIASDLISGWGSADTGDTWTDAVNYLDTWANKRATWMNAQLTSTSTDEFKVYLKNDANWQNVYAYAWDSTGNNVSWPGQQMTYNSETGYYEVTLSRVFTNIKFSQKDSNNNQTGDLNLGSANIGRVYNNKTGEWSDLSGSGTNYYLGGRISTTKGDIDAWGNSSNNTSLPFTLVDGETDLYSFDTGKTVAQLSAYYPNSSNYQYFFIHTGSGSTVANQWFGKTSGEFSSNTTNITLEQQTGTSTNDLVGLVRFNEPTSPSTDTVTLYFNSTTKELYYTAGAVGEYTITKSPTTNGSFTVSKTTANQGDNITITASPSTGFVVDDVTVTGANGTVEVTGTGNTRTFTMPASDVTVSVTFKSNPGTATQYQFLYSRSDNPEKMTAIDGTVYQNPTGTYTLTITDKDLISAFTAINGNSYFALSTNSSYQNMFKPSVNKNVTTETDYYISEKGGQEYGGKKFGRVSFKNQSEIKKLVLIYVDSDTNPTYTVNAYDTSSDITPLAESVTLEATPTTQVIGKKVTLKATLNSVNAKIPADAQFTYTFYCGSDVKDTITVTNKQSPVVATCTVSSDTPGIQSYTVTVSTKESDIQDYTPTDYESVTSSPVNVEYSDVVFYYAQVYPESDTVGEREAIPATNEVSTNVSDGGTYYFSVFDNATDTSPESVVDFTVDSANNRYCTISKSSTETGLDYFIVKCNAKCSNPVIYFNKANKTVYAIATQNVGSSKTLDSEKTVTYYFAEERYDSTEASNPKNGENGMRIKYWNNSVDKYDYTDVTNPVGSDGKTTTALSGNSIYARVDKFAGVPSEFPKWAHQLQREFYIYSVELPIWATSFNFVNSSDVEMTVNNTSQTGNSSCSSIVLNPNRIYCLFCFDQINYVRGVVLDESMWSNATRGDIQSNEVTTQGFASNIVNYKTETNDESGNVPFNTALTAKYGTDYEHPLYFNGWYGKDLSDTKDLYGSSYFKLHDNLAMRYEEPASYFASIQNLTDNRLSTTNKNKMGNGYLLGYNGTLMPLFDYEMLNENKTTLVNNGQLYENVQFPFYASTFNGVTTYSYDSTTDRNRVVKTTDDGKTTVNVSNEFVKPEKSSSYGYFPFEGTTSTNTYGFGTEFDINFYMTNNGKLSNGDDIAFNFSGDDDVWVYVDGVRVLDLGGAHSVSSGTINFSDMKVYYKTAANATDNVSSCTESWSVESDYVKTVSLADLFEANGATFSNKDASTQHTLQMFYLERGQGESNCSISFNLPQNTGFRVNSNVTTNNVNEALVQDTMASANKDYFNYQIANKLATETEYSNVHTKFTNAHARAESVGLIPSTNPSYPIKSILISREFLGTSYCLTAPNATTQNSSDTAWLDSVNSDTFTNLQNVNYTLSDAYAVKATSDDETSPSGRVSGTGIFNLLFGQSAIFESKIPNNTMIQLSQEDNTYSVNAGDRDTTVITAGTSPKRTVSNYYSSSYSIVDDNTGDVIGSGAKSSGETGSFYADDASDNSNMFYFANYSGDATASSNAMTVTYTNDVLTSQIKLAKTVENPSATDNFYFKVEFSKIFGENLATAKEYTDLQYKVYNSDGDSLVATRTYGKAGVYFTANQYAIIEGVPVDSAYNVVEKDRAGYKFDSASKTTYNGETAGETKNYNGNTVDGATVSGANGTTTYDAITFTNSKQAFTVNFKYYDRAVVSGTTSHISTDPTTVTYSFDSISDFTSEVNNVTTYNLEGIILKAYSEYNFDNLIDTYTSFTSQTNAIKDAGNFKVIREGITDVKPGETSYSTAYPSANLGLHYDCYGRPQGTDGCKVSDGEEWVTYYSGKTKLTEDKAKEGNSGVDSITVWLYNTLKKYKPTFYYASPTDNASDLTLVDGTEDRYVATTNKPFTIKDNVYYNVRLGGVNGNAQNDAATDYLKEYGISKGYCDEVPTITANVTYSGNSLKFLYWASDPSGKTILSTDIAYGYRVTNNLKAYAVYGKTDLSDKGLTIIPNTPDYYSNSTGKAFLRLNNVMNVYNCPERDTNIKNTSIIYIIDYSKADKNDGKTQMDKLIEAGGFDELQTKVRDVLKANEDSKSFLDSENIVINVNDVTFEKADYGDIDITGFNHKVVPYNEAITDTDEIKLTNKNRVQFTTSFTKSNLKGLKMYAMLGMDYGAVVTGKNSAENSWIVSDNLLYYAFDANGNVSSIKDPILDYTFYTTAS